MSSVASSDGCSGCAAGALRQAWSSVYPMAISVGPMNRPRKPNATKPPNTPRIVRLIGIATPTPINKGLMKLSITVTEDHENTPPLLVLTKEPHSRASPDHDDQRRADLA